MSHDNTGNIRWLELMRLAYLHLGIPPQQFWALTPKEFDVLISRIYGSDATITRSDLEELYNRFPDQKSKAEPL